MKRYAVSPITNNMGIVKGERHLISNWAPDSGACGSFNIEILAHDVPVTLFCLITGGCAHLDNANWTIIEEEDETMVDQANVPEKWTVSEDEVEIHPGGDFYSVGIDFDLESANAHWSKIEVHDEDAPNALRLALLITTLLNKQEPSDG